MTDIRACIEVHNGNV